MLGILLRVPELLALFGFQNDLGKTSLSCLCLATCELIPGSLGLSVLVSLALHAVSRENELFCHCTHPEILLSKQTILVIFSS